MHSFPNYQGPKIKLFILLRVSRKRFLYFYFTKVVHAKSFNPWSNQYQNNNIVKKYLSVLLNTVFFLSTRRGWLEQRQIFILLKKFIKTCFKFKWVQLEGHAFFLPEAFPRTNTNIQMLDLFFAKKFRFANLSIHINRIFFRFMIVIHDTHKSMHQLFPLFAKYFQVM